MRITNRYMANALLNSIQNSMSATARSQEQLGSGRRLLRPSDDPNVMGQFLSIKSVLSYIEQYNRNIADGLGYLDMSDVSMGTLGDILSRSGEYADQAANDTYNPDDRKAIAQQIDKMIDQVVDLANATVGGKYIYAGAKNSMPPFNREGDRIIYSGDTSEIRREVLSRTDYRIDCPGITAGGEEPGVFGFGEANGDGTYNVSGGIFEALFGLRDNLNNNDTAGIQDSISRLQLEMDLLLKQRVKAGARTSHFETLRGMLLDQELKLTENLQNIEGADMARLSIEFGQQLLSYQAALAAGSKTLQISLLDFLR